MATTAALTTWRRVFQNPEGEQARQSFESRAAHYRRLWQYYTNEAFTDLLEWAQYKSEYKLYRQIRALYNPTRRLVDFYAGQVYPGFLSDDGQPLPDGTPSAVPFPEDTPPALISAIAQFWQWTNWQAGKAVMVRFGGATGDVLVEIADDITRGKVTANILWPGLVADLELDAAGNVKAYTLEYRAHDPASGQDYDYRKEVDQVSYRTFRNNQPFAYDEANGPEWANPYGFVPAVWVTHRNVGTIHGDPAIAGSVGKIDELNSLVSHIHDQIHKKVDAPGIFWTNDNITGLAGQARRGSTDELSDPAQDRQSLLFLKGSVGGSYESLAGDLNLADATAYVEKLIAEIEADHPELVMYRELRGMREVTGPAAARLMGDVDANVREVTANYDQQSVKLFQMAVAIGGWRANGNGWLRPLTRQQERFLPFDLTSYERGQLDLSIGYRPLIPETAMERWMSEQAKWNALAAKRQLGVSPSQVLREAGYDEETITKMVAENAEDAAEAADRMMRSIDRGDNA